MGLRLAWPLRFAASVDTPIVTRVGYLAARQLSGFAWNSILQSANGYVTPFILLITGIGKNYGIGKA
jgi:hypothetical protein